MPPGVVDHGGVLTYLTDRVGHGDDILHIGHAAGAVKANARLGDRQQVSAADSKGEGLAALVGEALAHAGVRFGQGAVGEPAAQGIKVQLVAVDHQKDGTAGQRQGHYESGQAHQQMGGAAFLGGSLSCFLTSRIIRHPLHTKAQTYKVHPEAR